MSDISILLVEDDPTDVLCIKEHLAARLANNFTLREAKNLQAALSLMSHFYFDVILLDLELPDSSGLDTARRVIAEHADSAVIVLSGPDDEAPALQAVRYGAEDYLIKPSLSPAILQKSITYAITRRKVLQEKYDILSDLVLALEKIEHLESALPICAGCKKIYHEGQKRWISLEKYVCQQSNNGSETPICSDCQTELDGNV